MIEGVGISCPKCGQRVPVAMIAVAENEKAPYGLCVECGYQFRASGGRDGR